jgi:hypothetical protein
LLSLLAKRRFQRLLTPLAPKWITRTKTGIAGMAVCTIVAID